jgi:hypothetical protein
MQLFLTNLSSVMVGPISVEESVLQDVLYQPHRLRAINPAVTQPTITAKLVQTLRAACPKRASVKARVGSSSGGTRADAQMAARIVSLTTGDAGKGSAEGLSKADSMIDTLLRILCRRIDPDAFIGRSLQLRKMLFNRYFVGQVCAFVLV